MGRKRSHVPPLPAPRSYVIPRCASCGEKCQKDDQDNWYCPGCADAWLRGFVEGRTRGKSQGGVELPTGITDPRRTATPSFRDLIPNRAARRRARRYNR